MIIEVLLPSVAAQIAAGEVVERPASVVKELVENAIDAGANHVRVMIEEGGTRSIQVVDDGAGIPADQMMLAFSRHATSKLRTADDLTSIETLGFRGEALPSIAAVSFLTCTSRTENADAGTRITLRYGDPQHNPQPASSSPGTSTKVENLFSNQPARLKFLKTKPTEAAQVQRVMARYAMAYPQIRFQYVNDGRENFLTHGTGDLRETILQIWGTEVASKMLPVLLESPDVKVDGYAGNTDLHRSNRNDIAITVNGRWVQDRNLAWAVEKGYANSLPMGRHPIAVIHLSVPSNLVDVNAHPTKQEVRFRHESKIFSAVQHAVQESLSAHGFVHQPASRPFTSRTPTRGGPTSNPPSPTERHPPVAADAAPQRQGSSRTHQGGLAPRSVSNDPITHHGDVPTLVTADTAPHVNLRDVLPQLRVIGQAQRTFILADSPDGLYVLDQHAAHERVIYDQVRQLRDSADVTSQRLMMSEQANLDAFQHQTLVDHQDLISEHGFEFRHLHDHLWEVTALPQPLTRDHSPSAEYALQKLLDEFAAEQVISSPQQAIAATIACHSAARAGDVLGEAQMQAIIEQLGNTPEPHRCPHGRPTIIHLSKLRLEQEFRRR